MIGLGPILTEARETRGVTLDEAERETRISRRYLLALEEEEFDIFPAQVQARGFLRMYAQYLGLDTSEMLALFPQDSVMEESDGLIHRDRLFREQRPSARPQMPSIDLRQPRVVLAGGIVALLLVCGLIGGLCASGRERATAELMLLAEQGRAGTLRVPDVREDDRASALTKMDAAGITPIVIELQSDRVAAGLVIRQSPPPGTTVTSATDVVLFVSRGR